jgi:hypothetical protein
LTAPENRPPQRIADNIRALAARHGVSYTQTATDVWANHVTRISGDDVALDEIELLLVALQRAGHLSRPEALRLQVTYLREANGMLADQKEIYRTPWPPDFPDVVIHTTVEERDAHPCYKAAKAGDCAAAYQLVMDTISEQAIELLRAQIGDRTPILVPVGAIEHEGFNAIPDVMAREIADRLNLEVDDDSIGQSNKVGHTRARAAHRMVTPAIFTGQVRDGAEYVIVDDHVGLGGTIANLRGYIEEHGGKVIAVSTLTESQDSRKLALRPETLEALEKKHGTELDEFWRGSFGHGIATLTEAEGGNLLRQSSVDVIRTRMAKAAEEARGRGFSAVEISRSEAERPLKAGDHYPA